MNKEQYIQAENLFKDCLLTEDVDEIKTLKIFHDIYEKIMLPIKSELCFSTGLLVMLTHFSRPLNFLKFNINLHQESNNPYIPMNIYSMNILKSGGGKGMTSNAVSSCLNIDYIKTEYIKNLFNECNPELDEKEKTQELNNLINTSLAEKQSSASTAGLRHMYKLLNSTFNKIKLNKYKHFGSAFYELQEFADYLENSGSVDKDFFSTLKDMYDLGELPARSLSDGIREPITKFYISFLCATTDKTLQENPKISKLFNSYLLSGNARRSLLAFPSDNEFIKTNMKSNVTSEMDLKELYNYKRFKNDDETIELKKQIKNIVNRFCCMARSNNNTITITDECHFYFTIYKLFCEERAKKINNDILIVECENRFWKALKISGILALYLGYEQINKEVYLESIKIVEYYSHHLKRYLNNRVMGVSEKIAEILMGANKGITRAELRQNNEIRSYNSRGLPEGQFIDNEIKEVEQTLEDCGFTLMIEKRGYKDKTVVYWAKPHNKPELSISDEAPYKIYLNKPKGGKDELVL